MNLSRCSQGHFYDKEKYATCPHCSSGAGGEDGITMAFTEDLSNDVAPTMPLSEVTQPLNNEAVSPSPQPAASIPTPPPVATPQPIVQPQPAASIPTPSPIPQPPAGSIPTPPPAAPPVTPVSPSAVEEDEDSDVTVGFFGNIFETPEPKASSVAQTPETPAAPPKRKVSGSPCVGWLVAIGGNHVGEDFRLKVGKNFIGRDSSMDIALTNDKSVSRNKHVIVTYEPKQHLYLVQPGESSELAYLNSEVILTPVRIKAYDMITVGEVNLLFMPLCGERFDWTELPDEVD